MSGRRRPILALALLLAGAATGAGGLFACATGGGSQVQRDLDAIQQQLWKIQKENAALVEQIAALHAGRPEGPGPEVAESRLRLDALDRDLQALRARLEESDMRLGAVVQDLRSTRDALEALVRSLPPAGAPATGGTEAALAAGSAPLSVALEDLYRQGYAGYSKGNYALALQELGEFVRRYPSSDLADDAQYLIGEVHFSQQQYPEAVAAFERVVQSHAGGDRAVSAFFKKGLALLEMNRTADAVIQLQHVVTAYPKTEEARMARDRLRALGLMER
ncbi:MAG: tetratricopeptide repeat protein [Acidobacteria bacterium]|nr:tetratricopeptide repeat protein [Acidobacteriota bacterium]